MSKWQKHTHAVSVNAQFLAFICSTCISAFTFASFPQLYCLVSWCSEHISTFRHHSNSPYSSFMSYYTIFLHFINTTIFITFYCSRTQGERELDWPTTANCNPTSFPMPSTYCHIVKQCCITYHLILYSPVTSGITECALTILRCKKLTHDTTCTYKPTFYSKLLH